MKKRIPAALITFLVASLFPALTGLAADSFTIPAGTTIHARLTITLSTRTNQNGDPFTAKVVEPIFSGGEEVIPVGSTLEGHVSYVKEPGRVKGVAEMRLVPDSITTPDEVKFNISASLEEAQGAEGSKVKGEEGTIKGPGKSKKGAAVESGVGAGVGAGAGAIGAGGSGALYGAGIGALAGIIHSMGKHHKDIILPQGTEMTFVVSRTATAKKVSTPAESPAKQ